MDSDDSDVELDPDLPSESEIQTMDKSLEYIFSEMVRQGEMLDAVEFIRSIEVQFIPTTATMRTLMFEILMKNEKVKTLAYTSDYLYTVLCVYLPINNERRKFYFDSMRDNRGFHADSWTVFTYIVNSFFIQRNIYECEKGTMSDPIKYPNCKFLLELYVKLFKIDFKFSKSDSSANSLVLQLFWPKTDVQHICLSNRTDLLLKWINDIYSCSFVNNMPDLLQSMHAMLTLVVRCIIERRHNLSVYAAFSSAPLAEIVESIMNFCKDAFINLPNVKKFLCFLPLKYLQAKICEKIIKQKIKVSSKKYSVITLKDIVDQCMFTSRLGKIKNSNKLSAKDKKEIRKKNAEKRTFPDVKMENTKLHELCKMNKFADLLEELNTCDDINPRDPAGNTPLHQACSVGSRLCVRHLIDEGCSATSQTLEFGAFNLEGITPLHIAVMNDYIDIAKMLLLYGGAELLLIPDNKGQLPADLSTTDLMRQLLQEYDTKIKDSTVKDMIKPDTSAEKEIKENLGPAPILKNFKEYSIYLDALNCLLCGYCDMFNLYHYVYKKGISVSSHSEKKCCHFVGNDVCSEDAAMISQIPLIIETFIESITKNAAMSELHINIELIPLKGFVASLKKKP